MYGKYIKNPVAYCRLHGFVMPEKELKLRKCLSRRCYHMAKLENPYWQRREEIRALRKARKERIAQMPGI